MSSLKKSQKFPLTNAVSIARVYEDSRTLTFAFRIFPNNPTENIEFACSVFRKMSPKETYHRRKHVQTALGRLAVRPLYATFNFTNAQLNLLGETKEQRLQSKSTFNMDDWKKVRRSIDEQIGPFLRRLVYIHGVGSKSRLPKYKIKERRKAFGVAIKEKKKRQEEETEEQLATLAQEQLVL